MAIHDSVLDSTTDVSEYDDIYGDRKRSAFVSHPGGDKSYINSYFVLDFTLMELKQFRQRMRYNFRS